MATSKVHVHRTGSISITNPRDIPTHHDDNYSTVSATDLLDSYLYESEHDVSARRNKHNIHNDVATTEGDVWKRSLSRALTARRRVVVPPTPSLPTYHLDRYGRSSVGPAAPRQSSQGRYRTAGAHLSVQEPRCRGPPPQPHPTIAPPLRVLTTEEELRNLEHERIMLMEESSHLLDSHDVHDSVRVAFQVDDGLLYGGGEDSANLEGSYAVLDNREGEQDDGDESDVHEISDDEVVESLSPLRATRGGSSRLHQELVKLYEDFSSGLTLDAVRRDGDTSTQIGSVFTY